MNLPIYLDNNATTQVDLRVLQTVIDDLQNHFGNPSSTHAFGQKARSRLMKARSTIASYLGVKPQEIIFTSSGTEGINMLFYGLLSKSQSGHILTSSVEHACSYFTAKAWESKGFDVTYLSPGLWGAPKAEDVKAAIRPDTRLISLLAVNNETGVKTDLQGIAAIAQNAHIPFLVDGVALLGKEKVTIPEGVSAMVFSGHKLHAPPGIAFTFVRSNLKMDALLTGGEQEYKRRAGTENVAGIAALAHAISLIEEELPEASKNMELLREKLEKGIMANLPNVSINGKGPRICNTVNMAFEGIDGEALLTMLDMEGVAVSLGSACSSGALEPSRILLNMGIPLNLARSSIRFSLSRFTTEEEIDRTIEIVTRLVRKSL